jgi:sugar transferase (PEP-CTERM/EpsH1 system associated)
LIAPAGGLKGVIRGGLRLLAGGSVTEGYFHSRRLQRMIASEAKAKPFDLVFGYSSGILPLAQTAPAKARIMDLVDVDSAKWEAYAQDATWPKSWLYRREARGVRALERRAVEHFDAVILVSQAEVAALGIASPKVHAIGNGVDIDYFQPRPRPADASPNLVFTGSMDYRPNVEGVCWFAKEVWPQLKRKVPDLVFTVVGRDPAPAVKALAGQPGIVVTGTVPDVRPYLAAASVVVVPLLIARGIQNKILEAMAMGKAVVASPLAIEGLEVQPGRDVLEAQSAEQWHQCLTRLLGDADLLHRLGQQARQSVENVYSWDQRLAPLVELCLNLAGAARHGPVNAEGGHVTEHPSGKTTRADRRRSKCWQIVRRHYHDRGWQHACRKYDDLLATSLGSHSAVLDVGCGREFPLAPKLLKTGAEVHGIDPALDTESVPDLAAVTIKQGTAEAIPYPDDRFDVVVSRSVLEHIQNPQVVFAELYRVLKPGGKFIFLTPNKYDYVSLIASCVPNRFHAAIVKRMEGREERDTFPTFYRANSAYQLARLAAESGFEVEALRYENNYPSMFMAHPLLCRMAIGYDNLISLSPRLHWLRGWLLGCLSSTKAARTAGVETTHKVGMA